MMIRIGKTNIFLDRHDNIHTAETVAITDLPKYLGEPVSIEEGVTFKRIFELCIINRDIFNTIFYSFTRGFDIDFYIKDFLSEPKYDDGDIKYLEVYKTFEHFLYKTGENDWQYYHSFHGIGDPDKIGYGLLGLSLADLKNFPIKVNNELNIVVDTGKAKSFDEKYVSVHKAQIPTTLFEFIGAILFEITYHGTPENSKEFVDSLVEQSKAIERGDLETYELEKDEDGRHYFIDDNGNKEYLFDREDD